MAGSIVGICALPFEGQFSKWPPESQYWWGEIVKRATKVHFVYKGEYAAWKLLARNKWMVDNSDKVCALWNGSGWHQPLWAAAAVWGH